MTNKKKTHVSELAGTEEQGSRSSTPLSGGGDRESPAGSGSMEGFGSDPGSSTITPGTGTGMGTKKEKNEAYFAKLGSDNASRSDSLPPSQGGKYTGFGGGLPQPTSSPSPSTTSSGGGGGGAAARRSQMMGPGFDEFQKDPVNTLSKGFGWFASAVGKGAKSMNDSYIQPTAKTVSPLYLPLVKTIIRLIDYMNDADSRIRLRSSSPRPSHNNGPKHPSRRAGRRRLFQPFRRRRGGRPCCWCCTARSSAGSRTEGFLG